MSPVTEPADVEVPVHTACHQWTQVESFQRFMEGVDGVTAVGRRPEGARRGDVTR